MSRALTFIVLAILVAAAATTAYAIEAAAVAVEAPPVNELGAVPNRDQIIACAQNWVDREVPYCQCNGPEECCGSCPYCGTFRCDCSGYVTYCLQLPAGLNTNSLPLYATAITKDELQKGDFMDCVGDHVVFFAGWTDSSKTAYVVYQEPGCHTDGPHHAFKSVTTYPFGTNTCFKPYRRESLAAIESNTESAVDSTMASAKDLKEAFLQYPNLEKHSQEDKDKVVAQLRAHGKDLGFFTF
eukprot:GDKJ01004298.1.p1 GENE.GDKJ01004298.1~~GDKJ01004298.1.p1  ORF type:complete len:241 (+),score=12.48 GDKJ01004298.1:72-794(+)